MEIVGFIGLGIMGKPMARNMLSKGSKLLVFDINKKAVNSIVKNGASFASLKEIGKQCSFIFTILPDGETVKDVLFMENGVASCIRPGTVVVDMSSVTPIDSKFCSEGLAEKKVEFLDAPVSGGEPKAIDGTLSFMVGGKKEVFNKVRPLLMQMGKSAVLTGAAGSGSITKLANQIIVNINIAALGEALVFATKANVDPEKVIMAIKDGLAGSCVMDAKAPMMINRDFKPGGKISTNYKDIKNVLKTSHGMNIPIPLTAHLFEIMNSLNARNLNDNDHSAIVKYFELLANKEVGEGSN